jgi:hypothetical protein
MNAQSITPSYFRDVLERFDYSYSHGCGAYTYRWTPFGETVSVHSGENE